jgi:putative nucleotidyltransferase-like protein
MQKPECSAHTIAAATETLAQWLARGWPSVSPTVLGWRAEEWQAAAWIAYWQGGIPLLAERLREANLVHAEHSPGSSSITAILEIASLSHGRTSRMLTATVELIDGLRAERIETLPLKGMRLAPFYYEPPTLRPMGDIDLLIRPADVERASAWALAHGYTFYSRSEEDVVYLRGERRAEVWHPENVLPVELHFRLREEFGGAGLTWDLSDEAWRSARRAPYLNSEANLIAPVVLLRHLCAHASSDIYIRRGKLHQLEDIARVARTFTTTEWSQFVAAAPAPRARFVVPALALTARYYDNAIPADVLGAMRAALKPRLQSWADRLTLADVSESNLLSRSGIGLSLSGLIAETPAETSRALVTSLLPPRWNLMKRYPRLAASPLYPLCYVLLNADRAWQILRAR